MTGDLEKSRRLYQTLLLPDFSSVEEVRQAYKSLALKYHPDKNLADPSAAEKFRDVRVAYEILSNVERKQKYDCTLRMYQPLGANSFTPGIRTPRAGCPADAGYNPYMPTGNTTSSIYEELNSYAARRAGKQQRRSFSAASSPEDRASQYTKEQQEFFKKREKEHRAKLQKRLAQERKEQIARDLEALRREQERREETQQRSRQLRPGNEARRACASVGSRRASPFPRVPMENLSHVGTSKELPKVFSARVPHSPGGFSDMARPLQSPRPPRPLFDAEADRAERVRREKERQAEVRRAEQEKYMDRLIRQRMRETRMKERELEEAERRERENKQQVLMLDEKSVREQVIEAQEQIERRRLWRQYKLQVRWHVLQLRLRQISGKETIGRILIQSWEEEQFELLCLQRKESWGRTGCQMDEDLAWNDFLLYHVRIQEVIFAQKQCKLISAQSMEFEAVCSAEAVAFAILEVQRQESVSRLQLMKDSLECYLECYRTRHEFSEQELMRNALIDERGIVIKEEALDRAFLFTAMQEWRGRCALEEEEEDAILEIIQQRASERQGQHLREVEQARLLERQSQVTTIAALQAEVRRLRQDMYFTSAVPPSREEESFALSLPHNSELLRDATMDTPPKSIEYFPWWFVRQKDHHGQQ
ncbi:putative chaperone DNAJ protein [Trypanosoma rangeli]|uniref:Putative chaperone DNAJ protein n=1 Tax=Trypanosoma rangeli TaxID=5698 RepID=A0A422NIQ3_TRYRA|nr:putative chaperone DNAJ protein [Trypanosoma rangeli]RNF05337.1 putative chaperone DNAJ protein [Trypanosoma rangeli]|eukprot:RNF05337.1 putative chaperone DNAJ protein [Trypanosoma rangeli]